MDYLMVIKKINELWDTEHHNVNISDDETKRISQLMFEIGAQKKHMCEDFNKNSFYGDIYKAYKA